MSRLEVAGPLRALDRLFVALALASVVVFLLDRGLALVGGEARALVALDLALAAAFAVAFLARGARSPAPGRWFVRHAWLAAAALPLTVALVPDPWHVLVQVAVVALRAGDALDAAFHARVVEGLAERYAAMLVERATGPLLMKLADALEEAVTSRDYAAAVGRRLHEREALVEAAVARAIAESPHLGRLAALPPVRHAVEEATRELVGVVHAALTGPELNALVRESLRDACEELKAGIQERKWVRKGVGLTDVWTSVVHPEKPPA